MAETSSYSVRVSGDGQHAGLLRALQGRPDMRIVAKGGVGMAPPGGSAELHNLPNKSYSVWVEGVSSEDEAKEAVESLLSEVGVPGAIQDASRLSD